MHAELTKSVFKQRSELPVNGLKWDRLKDRFQEWEANDETQRDSNK